jgi:LemA protein
VIILIIVAIVVIVLLWALVTFNGFVQLRNRVENAWAQIDVQLKRRLDLIPNLIETVKGYAAHEKGTLDAVVQARNAGAAANSPAAAGAADAQMTGALGKLFALSEAYPDLKANQNFLALQEELSGTEGKIAYARQFYNDTLMKYNTKIQSFPASLMAGVAKATPREYFQAEEAARTVPKVQF